MEILRTKVLHNITLVPTLTFFSKIHIYTRALAIGVYFHTMLILQLGKANNSPQKVNSQTKRRAIYFNTRAHNRGLPRPRPFSIRRDLCARCVTGARAQWRFVREPPSLCAGNYLGFLLSFYILKQYPLMCVQILTFF